MNNVEFAKTTIVKVLPKMEEMMVGKVVKEYLILIDTLEEVLPIFEGQQATTELFVFLNLLEKKLESECQEIMIAANKSIDRDEYRENINWIRAFSKIERIRNDLQYVIQHNKGNKILTTPQQSIVFNKKGTHMVISNLRSSSVFFIFEKFKSIHSGLNQSKFTSDAQDIYAFGINDDFRGKRGEVLHIDRDISLINYLKLIEPLIVNFKTITFIN